MVRCTECHKRLMGDGDLAYFHWMVLANFIDFLKMEQYIEVGTHDQMMDSLMYLKQFTDMDAPPRDEN